MTDITWSHIFGGTGSIVFTNTINQEVTTVDVTFDADGTINVLDDAEADTGGNTITIENGIYDIELSQTATTALDYVPVSASITGQAIAANQTLSFTATTTYGLVLLEINEYLDDAITPTFTYEGSATDMTANEGYYYVYVPASTGNVLTATESFYNQELTQALEVVASETNAYYFEVTTFDQAVDVSLENFSQTNSAVEVLFPLNVGDFYQGGIVFYIFTSEDTGYVEGETHGLISAVEDQSSGIQWHNGISVTTGATSTAIGTGSSNTDDVIAVQGDTETDYATGLAKAYNGGGYTDWFLPSQDELNLMYINKTTINTTALANGGTNFTSSFYWSSSEGSGAGALEQNFNNGAQGNGAKQNPLYVRAVRAF